MKTERIIQIMPAPGWYARYETAATELVLTVDLVAWALVERDDFEGDPCQRIEGQVLHPVYGWVVSADTLVMTQEQGHELKFLGYGRDA